MTGARRDGGGGGDARDADAGRQLDAEAARDGGPDAAGTDGGGADAGSPRWRVLGLVFRNLDVTIGGERYVTSLSDGEEAAVRLELSMFPARIEEWSDGMGSASMTVVMEDEPLTSLTPTDSCPGSYLIDPADAASALARHAPRGAYDSVIAVFDADDDATGRSVPVGCFFGWFVGEIGMTYASFMAFYDSPPAGPYVSEGYVHEWLHGATYWYRSRDFTVPDPHENADYGFPDPNAEGSWWEWYHALMTGTLRDGHGITEEVWASPTPREILGRPRTAPWIRAASWDGEWLYVEWDWVEGATTYRREAELLRPDGSTAASATQEDAGGSDRGDFRYAYFHRTDLCAGAAAGSYGVAVEVSVTADPGTVQRHEVEDATVACP